MTDQTEQEVKFYLQNLPGVEERLRALGAVLHAPRVHEQNLRFDLPNGELTKTYQVLRLRQDERVRLTYKGLGEIVDGARVRPEIEFEASEFEAAKAFLEALGYSVSMIYEKYRTSYRLGDAEVMLDETPLGNFAEIEGASGSQIEAAAQRLNLDWESRINESYAYLFLLARASLGFSFRDMTFSNFKETEISLDAMGLRFADL